MTGPEPQPIAAAEAEDYYAVAEGAFHRELHPDDLALEVRALEPERALAVREGGRIVATTAAHGRALSLPGGASVPVAAVTAVGVLPGHTRRGHLRRLMRRQLDDVRAAREPIACLWASEAALYGRYGYGPGIESLVFEVRTPAAALRADAPRPEPRPHLVEPEAAVGEFAVVYDAVRAQRPGMLDRTPAWWERRVADPEHRRDGAGRLRAVIQPGPAGEPAGYALYAVDVRWGDHGPDGELRLRELVAATPEAEAGLWEFLLGLDLVRTLVWRFAAPDHALRHLLARRDALMARTRDGLWVRLVDLDRALAARSYSVPFSLVLEVDDAFCPWNAGRHRLAFDGTAATCEPTSDEAELALSAETLAAAYLGGTSLAALAAAGRVRELRPGALRTAAVAFRWPTEPWCPEVF